MCLDIGIVPTLLVLFSILPHVLFFHVSCFMLTSTGEALHQTLCHKMLLDKVLLLQPSSLPIAADL